MTTEEFTYWLQGALELNPNMLEEGMTPEQVQTIQDHLDLVFDKVTPDRFKVDSVVPKNNKKKNSKSKVKCNKSICKNSKSVEVEIPEGMGYSDESMICTGGVDSLGNKRFCSRAEDLSEHMDGDKPKGGAQLLNSC